ncbi:MAG: hypothetical protein JKY93_03155 [Gammaproteobacteria bacterium]|nr:hypothetical protein [Gammaproteobacteria bacterium]
MARRKIKLPSFNAVGASQTATIDIPVGARFHNIKIFYKDNAIQSVIESDITMIRIKVNGKVQRTYKPAELYKTLKANGHAFIAGIIPIYFSEPWRRNVVSEDVLAWGTSGLDTFQIELDIASGATAPKLHAYAVTDNVIASLSNIIKVRRQVIPVSQTGLLTVSTLSKRADEIYHRMHCFEGADGDIESVEIKQDGYDVYSADVAVNDANMADRDIVSQTGVFHIMFDDTQRTEDGLVMVHADGKSVQDFQVNFQMANATTFTLLTEVRGNPD